MSWTVWLQRHAGLDRAVLLTLSGRAWSAAAGAVTIVLVGRWLTPAQQGYYYTFASLIALQVFAELGLTYALAQFASHEMAALQWTDRRLLVGDPRARQRVRALVGFAARWFGAAGLVLVLVLGPLGPWLAAFDRGTALPEGVAAPWLALVGFSALSLPLAAVLAVIEGCGQVQPVATIRLAQVVAGSMAGWLTLPVGALHSLAAQAAAACAVLVLALAWTYRPFLQDLWSLPPHGAAVRWRDEIWPFHWRIAVSWMSGYLILQLFNPLLFATAGPVEAGRMGLSLQIMGALNAMALAWVSAQTPTYGRLAALGQGAELDRLFRAGLVQSTTMLVVGLGVVLLLDAALARIGSPLAERVLPWQQLAWLSIAALANHVVFAQAAVLRAHKQEPFMVLSVAHGLVTAALAVALIPAWGVSGAVLAHAVGTIGVSLVGGTVIFRRKRKLWWMRDANA